MPRVLLLAGSHPIYKSLAEHPPNSAFEVSVWSASDRFDRLSIYTSKRYVLLKNVWIQVSRYLGIPRLFVPPGGFDLIHACRGIIPISRTPSVVDVEHVTSFTNMDPIALKRSIWLLRRLLARPSLRFILPHSYAAARSIQEVFGEQLAKQKLRVVYPAALPAPCTAKPGSHDTFTILFIGKNFVMKGGRALYLAYRQLSQEHRDIRLVLKSRASEIPRKILADPGVTVIASILPYEDVLRLYCTADVFVMPTYMDTFGYVFIEAMAAGLPVIGTDVFAVPEIIEDGYNGFIVHSPIRWHNDRFLHALTPLSVTIEKEKEVASQLAERIHRLLDDRLLLKKMSKNALSLTREGKFSIEHRNKELSKIYAEALELA